jgi:hypothetical protein
MLSSFFLPAKMTRNREKHKEIDLHIESKRRATKPNQACGESSSSFFCTMSFASGKAFLALCFLAMVIPLSLGCGVEGLWQAHQNNQYYRLEFNLNLFPNASYMAAVSTFPPPIIATCPYAVRGRRPWPTSGIRVAVK